MIRTLQKKFIVTAMVAVTVLLLVLLGAINVFNYLSSSRQSDTSKLLATDYTIFGIVDSLTLRGIRTYDKAKEASHAAG